MLHRDHHAGEVGAGVAEFEGLLQLGGGLLGFVDAVERPGQGLLEAGRGWAAGLTIEGGGAYMLVGTTTLDEALLAAAKAIAETGRPVGLLVWRGRHAWVMSGFRATGDPLTDPNARVTSANRWTDGASTSTLTGPQDGLPNK